jgi:hypothetical protein
MTTLSMKMIKAVIMAPIVKASVKFFNFNWRGVSSSSLKSSGYSPLELSLPTTVIRTLHIPLSIIESALRKQSTLSCPSSGAACFSILLELPFSRTNRSED